MEPLFFVKIKAIYSKSFKDDASVPARILAQSLSINHV